ncbi:pantetheine-phosphate adenylyltransferase [Proteocatella sphenisci]|uniref:pantetheine-phosphate adenylyltransferase n=1 Tax=Proteocatella sphenisci TaxID=181070 RepID=UPI00049095AB|nr:pantetheine-phosphate adenylyltransferase [Proteocatella sphenisci]
MNKKKAVYPGSFDPLTNGHIDIIKRASDMYDEVTVALLVNTSKKGLLSFEERLEILKIETASFTNVKVDFFGGLLVEYCREKDIKVIIRGLRAVSDYEYEMQIAQMNRNLNKNVETIFLMTNTKYSFLSSSVVKEVAKFGGDISEIVPKSVDDKLKQVFGEG